MAPGILVGFVAFFLVSLVVGLRLLQLAHRTRALPELLIGLGVLGIGPIGFGAMMVASGVVEAGTPADAWVVRFATALSLIAVLIGTVAKCVFNWRVYRPDSIVARSTAAGIALALIVLFAHEGLSRGFVPSNQLDWPTLLQNVLRAGALLWGAGEAGRYWRLMRKRRTLGLADPVVTNRFFLWSAGAGAAGVGSALGTAIGWWSGVPSHHIPWVVAMSSAFGLAAAVAMGLAFLAPKPYLRWVRAQGTMPVQAASD